MPYEEHPIFKCPDEDQVIWRYISFTKLIWICQERKIHFHRTGDFDDPYEGMVPEAITGMRKKSIETQLEKHSSDADIDDFSPSFEEIDLMQSIYARTIAFANCWYAKDFESAAMWELYRNRGKPICIKSSISSLVEAVNEINESVYIGEVVYVDHDSSVEELNNEDYEKLIELYSRTEHGNLLYPILSKRKEFSHESEVRAIYSDHEPLQELGASDRLIPDNLERIADDYKNLNVDIDSLIEEIYIGPDTPSWVADTVRSFVKESDLDLNSDEDIRTSDLDQQPLDFE